MIGFIKRYKEAITMFFVVIISAAVITALVFIFYGGYKQYTIIEEKEIYIETEESNLQIKKIEYDLYNKEEDIIYIIYVDDKISQKDGKCIIDISNYKIIKKIENVTEKGKKVND